MEGDFINGYQYPYTPPTPAPASSDKKGNRQQGKKQGKKGQNRPKEKTGTPNTNLPRTSLTRPSKQHFYCHFHGGRTDSLRRKCLAPESARMGERVIELTRAGEVESSSNSSSESSDSNESIGFG
jgi:hypothetical protein